MECIIFIGIQASGKSTFYKEKFFKTHVRINLDMLKTRNREDIYIAASIKAMQSFVVDNTNPTINDRKKYIEIARENKFKIKGYYFKSDYNVSFSRNEKRHDKEKVPEIAIKSTLKKLQLPTATEGFDELYQVISSGGEFAISKME
ncbi:AAA family ATPase [Paenibacillus methanolicus]|uniref:Putative kinase n=1 Tax=Paenibacillus methanolicus TaxID=582686 RepID=A0A5S5C003_9BACL|nr:AAA family ATPase [Paenibacillus methanolicus]TYP71948.1 putative kinase [Paenibacillus methanolicus]